MIILVGLSGSQARVLTRPRPGLRKCKISRFCFKSHTDVNPFVRAVARILATFRFQDAASISSVRFARSDAEYGCAGFSKSQILNYHVRNGRLPGVGNLSTSSSGHQQFRGDGVELDDFDSTAVCPITGDQWRARVCKNGIDVPDIQMSIVHGSGNHSARLVRRDISPREIIEPDRSETVSKAGVGTFALWRLWLWAVIQRLYCLYYRDPGPRFPTRCSG